MDWSPELILGKAVWREKRSFCSWVSSPAQLTVQLHKGLHQHGGKDSVGLGWKGQVLGEKQKGSSQLMLLKKWMKNQALENLTEVFQQVCLPYLYLYHCFVLTCCSRGSLHMQNACWEVPLFIVWGFLPVPLSNSSGTHRRSKVGKWGGNPGREASVGVVFILHHVTLPVRTLGCTNEEIKGERIMAALYKITCIRRATTFGWPLEQWVPVQFQENVWDRNRKAKVT